MRLNIQHARNRERKMNRLANARTGCMVGTSEHLRYGGEIFLPFYYRPWNPLRYMDKRQRRRWKRTHQKEKR